MLHNNKIYINSTDYKEVLNNTIKNRDIYLNQDELKLIENKVKRLHNVLFL